jgi:hypothetical protein
MHPGCNGEAALLRFTAPAAGVANIQVRPPPSLDAHLISVARNVSRKGDIFSWRLWYHDSRGAHRRKCLAARSIAAIVEPLLILNARVPHCPTNSYGLACNRVRSPRSCGAPPTRARTPILPRRSTLAVRLSSWYWIATILCAVSPLRTYAFQVYGGYGSGSTPVSAVITYTVPTQCECAMIKGAR